MFKSVMIAVTLACLTCQVFAQENDEKPAQVKLESVQQKVSYGIGLSIGQNLKQQGIDVESAAFLAGLMDALKGNDMQLSDSEIQEAMVVFQKQLQARQARQRMEADPKLKALAEKNEKDGAAYLASNGKKEGVKTLKSGLQYRVIKSGEGKASPKKTSAVRTHYHGTLTDGTVFDSSVKRGEPAEFRVDQVIAGWTEALQLMKEGDKWELVIPSELAYGVSPRPGGPIGPNAVLIFEVELIKILD